MRVRLNFAGKFLVALLASLAVAGLLACSSPQGSGGSLSSSPRGGAPATPETQRSIATAIALRAAGEGSGTVKPAVSAGPRTAAEISRSAATSGLLDSKHLAAGVGCDSCHGAIPASGTPTEPSTSKCLSCHGGSYDALAARTAGLGARNPHKAHTGRQDCDRCHHLHQPFEYLCNSCHTFPIPEKYLTGTAVESPGEPAQTPSDGGAAFKETED